MYRLHQGQWARTTHVEGEVLQAAFVIAPASDGGVWLGSATWLMHGDTNGVLRTELIPCWPKAAAVSCVW